MLILGKMHRKNKSKDNENAYLSGNRIEAFGMDEGHIVSMIYEGF